MPRKKAVIDLAERAKFYGVCERTIRRWIDARVNVHCLESVGTYLLESKNPAEAALKTVIRKL